MYEKYNRLLEFFQKHGKTAIAFSGGVDSTFLLYAAKEALKSQVVALTAASDFIPEYELQEAKDYCIQMGMQHFICHMNVLDKEEVAANPKNRCYHCKKGIFTQLKEMAEKQGCSILVEGSNVDDLKDYRPGAQAIQEIGVYSPLKECGLTKAEIRALSKEKGIPTWDKPAFACLASRIPYGERITKEKLRMVDRGEQILKAVGFVQYRVRIHDAVARIELLPEDFEKILEKDLRQKIYQEFKMIGFQYVALDLIGYRTGSLNEILQKS